MNVTYRIQVIIDTLWPWLLALVIVFAILAILEWRAGR